MKANKFVNDEGAQAENSLSGVGVTILVLVIVGAMAALIGNELTNATTLTTLVDGNVTGTHWSNISNETGEMATSGFNILGVGVVLIVIMAAVGWIILPHMATGQ